MKNLAGRVIYRLSGTRRNRFICIIVFPLLLLGFLLSGRGVYADSEIPQTTTEVSYTYNSYSWNVGLVNVSTVNYLIENSAGQAWLNSEDRCFIDVTFKIKETFSLDYYRSSDPNNLYMGYFNSTGGFTITATKNNSDTVIDGISYIKAEHDFPFSFQNDTSSFSTSTVGNMYNLNFTRRQFFNFYDLKFINTRYIENQSSYTFRVFYHSNTKYAAGVTISANLGTFPTGTGSVVYYKDPLYYEYNSNETLKSILSSLTSGNSNIVSAINTASATAHSDSVNTQNIMTTDSTGTSTVVAGIENDYNTAQSQADDAVDNAVHNYNNDLDTVENFDFTSFFTSQRSAATFWRDVGEYILNSGELGFVASGVIITTLITLFVFMLRL